MKVVSADSSCSVVWLGARAACAEVSPGSVEASKAKYDPVSTEDYNAALYRSKVHMLKEHLLVQLSSPSSDAAGKLDYH
jgi:hypothetical protein